MAKRQGDVDEGLAFDIGKTSNRISPRYHLPPSDIVDYNACTITVSTLFYFEELMAMAMDLQCVEETI